MLPKHAGTARLPHSPTENCAVRSVVLTRLVSPFGFYRTKIGSPDEI